jgi:hypothetical protein
VNYDIQFVGKVKTALFGGEGLFFATLTGPGASGCSRCRSRLADRIYKAAPQTARAKRCSTPSASAISSTATASGLGDRHPLGR